jgi:acyl-CoA reductase-like NAD-dependent aldehyde dehydrogenase
MLPDDDCYARNLIGGHWQFPAAPYDFEIRSPADATITAVVPLSSRIDVAAAAEAARAALRGPWAEPAARAELLASLLDRIDASRADLTRLQCAESGLSPADAARALDATLILARRVLRTVPGGCGAASDPVPGGGVSGHVLSWGLPFTEIVTSVLTPLARGDTVIVKPSLRGPLAPAAFGYLATQAGLPAGVVNIVQGTGVDVGASLISQPGLSALYVRAGERTIAQAERAVGRTRVPLRTLRAGGNVIIVGPGGQATPGAVADAVAAAVRVHSNGGPFALPLLAVHRDEARPLLAALTERLSRTVAAPLPTQPLRQRSLDRISELVDAGADLLLGGKPPDDVAHRMGWRIPPALLMLGPPGSAAARAEQASVPLGPVLSVVTWGDWDELGSAFTAQRNRDGLASITAGGRRVSVPVPHGQVTTGAPASLLDNAAVPAAWLGGAR